MLSFGSDIYIRKVVLWSVAQSWNLNKFIQSMTLSRDVLTELEFHIQAGPKRASSSHPLLNLSNKNDVICSRPWLGTSQIEANRHNKKFIDRKEITIIGSVWPDIVLLYAMTIKSAMCEKSRRIFGRKKVGRRRKSGNRKGAFLMIHE